MTPPDAVPQREDPIQRHRREMWRAVYRPLLFGGLIIMTAVLLVVVLVPTRSSLVADLMLSCLVFVPMLICLFPLYLVLIVSGVYVGRGRGQTQRQLDGLRTRTEALAARAERYADVIDRRVVDASARLAVLNVFFNVFDPPDDKLPNRSDSTDDPS